MSLYIRARKHIDMNRVKELREEKIKREQIAEILRQQEEIRAELEYIEAEESKYVNWRRELEEEMTTSGMGMVNYPSVGEVNLGAAMGNISLSGDGGPSGYNATTQDSTSSYYKFDTMVVSITTTSSDWVISPGEFIQDLASGGSGSHTIVLPRTYSSLYFSAKDDGTFSASVQYQRRRPVNALVSLDDPEANSFIRDGQIDSLSPGEKKKKLEEQLRSSNEYLNKMFGKGMPNTATTIADYEPQQSFMDMASDARNPMGTGDQALALAPAALLASPMVQAAAAKGLAALAALVGGVGTAKQIMKSLDAGKYGGEYGSTPGSGVDARSNPGDRGAPSMDGRHQQERDAADKAIKDAEAQYGQDSDEARQARQNKNDTMTRQRRERKSKNVKPPTAKQDELQGHGSSRKEHYKPNGSYISEKKRLKSPKDLADKIPGYYDGKPSPLGFPIVEPPKMVNGYHPDLVDGKKVANRFNRLDPISARAMPKTGNPHIDKKVRAAAKKPK